MKKARSGEAGFTIIELLTIMGVVGVLSALSLTGLKVYKGNAAFGVAETTLGHARTSLEAGILSEEGGVSSVPLTTQKVQGEIIDPLANDLLPALLLPRNVKFQVEYDNGCDNQFCQESMLQLDHCHAENYVRWIRYGDGVAAQLELPGSDCS